MDHYPGIDGFLGTRASLMLDLLILVMVVMVAALGWSVFQVKYRRRTHLHRWFQVGLVIALLVAVLIFETDIRINGWQERAVGAVDGQVSTGVWIALAIHLVFAVTTLVLWPIVIIRAIRGFGWSPRPNAHSAWHLRWARVATFDLLATAVTGWVFYVVAFV